MSGRAQRTQQLSRLTSEKQDKRKKKEQTKKTTTGTYIQGNKLFNHLLYDLLSSSFLKICKFSKDT